MPRVIVTISLATVLLGVSSRLAEGGSPSSHRTTVRKSDGATMVIVPAGPFTMGSHCGAPDEAPPHIRDLPEYSIDVFEVTIAQYARFVAETGHRAPAGWVDGKPPPGTEQLPITNIPWASAMRYAVWAGGRLPTEAEWEKAARGADGRRYPWGDADDDAARNNGSGRLSSVGSHPRGAAPSGCLDMSGNAWEWTADWYLPYPGGAASVHHGRHYKVLRGGGGEYLYALTNPGTTTHRARLVPYGSHDFVGFRCVTDPPGGKPPYDAEARLREAEDAIRSSLRAPRRLLHEERFAAVNDAGMVPLRVVGPRGQAGLVTAGVPMPRGRVPSVDHVSLLDDRGAPLPLSARALATWPDGCPRWLLLRFPAETGQLVRLRLSKPAEASTPPPGPRLRVEEEGDRIRIDTSAMEVELDREAIVRSVRVGGRRVLGPLEVDWIPDAGPGLSLGAARSIEIESRSPLHAEVRLRGDLVDEGNRSGPVAYDLRVRATAGSRRLRLWLTVLHARPRERPWDAMRPRIDLRDWRLRFALASPAERWVLGGDRGPVDAPAGGSVVLRQGDDVGYAVTANQRPVASGTRAPGWLSAVVEGHAVTLGARHFWQNHPKTLQGTDRSIGIGLWAGEAPFPWEGGLAKTHELSVEISDQPPAAFDTTPLRAVPPPAWMCGTEAAGALLPRNEEALRHLAYWECWRESAMRRWVNAMPTGLRDFGDGYMGGPYKGKNAYVNLEYDVPLNLLHQYLRTGAAWYLEAAGCMVRHQADIDTENVSGFSWKHSPSHTTTQAEFGHVFVRGMLLHHLLTGELRGREVAERIGDWVARSLLEGRGVGNERQIGWSLYALSALHELTRKPLYLEGAQALCDRLVRGQAPTGKFDIRWDNRIAFFNGIAMSGMLEVDEISRQPGLEECILRVGRRTLGMVPDYACRTLNAYCWILRRGEDPRFLHNMERTWASSLEFLLDRDPTTSETHAWRFPSFAVRYGLFPQLADGAAELPEAGSWRSIRFRRREVDLYLMPRGDRSPRLLVVREGLTTGEAVLHDAAGRVVRRLKLSGAGRLLETVSLSVPSGGPWHRLHLSAPGVFAWQVHHDERTALTVADPEGEQLPDLLPRAVGRVEAGAEEVVLRLEATGEGFHSATLFDAGGAPVGRVQRFIDFGDPGRYEMELKAPVKGPLAGWALELNAVRVSSIEGMLPYWAARAEDLFLPERILVGAAR